MTNKEVFKDFEDFFNLFEGLGKIQKTGIKNLLPILASSCEVTTYAMGNLLQKKYKNREYQRQYVTRRFADPKMNSSLLSKPVQMLIKDEKEIILTLDQTEIGGKFAILCLGVICHDRAILVDWEIEEGEANLGFERQKQILDRVLPIFKGDIKISLYGDRFYGSIKLIKYCQEHDMDYRIRMKKNIEIDTGEKAGKLGEVINQPSTFIEDALIFEEGIKTNIGYIKDESCEEGWYIAMSAKPTRKTTLDYKKRWKIECLFKDLKSGGFNLQNLRLETVNRLNGLLTYLAIAVCFNIFIGLMLKKK